MSETDKLTALQAERDSFWQANLRLVAEKERALTRIAELEEAMTTPPHGGAQVKLWMWNKTPAALDVLDERFRQISAEGWTTDHDDQHDTGEMAKAAATYALHSTGAYGKRALTWPWSPSWWKPTTPRHDLVKAAALIIAEIERIDRIADMAERTKGGDQ